MRTKRVLLIICAIAVPIVALFVLLGIHELVDASDLMTGSAILGSTIIGFLTYTFSRRNQVLAMSENKRDEFLRLESLSHIRMLIEHNDIELQTVVAIANIAQQYEYDSDTLPRGLWRLQEQFDEYLGFLEGVSILHNHGHMFRESAEGLFQYCLNRLRDIHTCDADTNGIKTRKMEDCMEKIYEGKIPEWIETAWQQALSKKIERRAHDPITGDRIDPLEKPIWFYINSEGKEFDALRMMVKKFTAKTS